MTHHDNILTKGTRVSKPSRSAKSGFFASLRADGRGAPPAAGRATAMGMGGCK
jgi:hypothetical protein